MKFMLIQKWKTDWKNLLYKIVPFGVKSKGIVFLGHFIVVYVDNISLLFVFLGWII